MHYVETEELVEDWAFSGMEYLEIKRRLKAQAWEGEELRLLMLTADEAIAEYQLLEQERQKQLIRMILWGGLTLIGLLLNFLDPAIVARFPLLRWIILVAGGWFLWRSWKRYRTPVRKADKLSRRLQSKKRFKRFSGK